MPKKKIAKKPTIGICGAGKMGQAIANGISSSLLNNDLQPKLEFTLIASTRSKVSAEEFSKKCGIKTTADNRTLAKVSDIIILSVKPHQAKDVLTEMAAHFKKDALVISVCASLTTDELKTWAGRKPFVIRAMPNTPCLINEGMTALTPGHLVKRSDHLAKWSDHLEIAQKIFNTLGKSVVVEEALMDAVTGLSGCGPAYMYLIIEALSDAGVKCGLSRKIATLLATQTMLGSAKMALQSDAHPAALKDEVTTPAGCTIDGLMALEDGALRSTLIKAVVAATKRSALLRN